MSQISVQNLSKSFIIPHKRQMTLKEGFVDLFGILGNGILSKPENERFFALKNINLEIKEGEFVGVIGANGSGKSTLLKILAGIYRQDCGNACVKGEIAPLLELGIGFQPDLSARDNIYINAALLGLQSSQICQLLPKIVEFAEIENFLDLKIKNYSSGMRQRLAFAIAANLKSDIYLCDEVFAVGDESFQNKCLEIFLDWHANGKTIILVSHNTSQIGELCDRAILMESGRIVADGEAKTVIENYRKRINFA